KKNENIFITEHERSELSSGVNEVLANITENELIVSDARMLFRIESQ
ncbi:1512_t:CDS:1, partial [Gigaspora rosea]